MSQKTIKPYFTAALVGTVAILLLGLEIYVDINTSMENATTPYQKNVMGCLAALLGIFGAIAVLASSALKKLGKKTAFYTMATLSVALGILSIIIWISFFCTMWIDYSNKNIKESLVYQAKDQVLKTFDESVAKNEKLSSQILVLNKQASLSELAVKNCNNLKADPGSKNRWKKITNCKNKNGADFDIANSQLNEIVALRNTQQSKFESVSNIAKESVTDFVMMPLASIITSSRESGTHLMLSIAIFITLIVSAITNGGLYWVGSLIGDDYIKTHPSISIPKPASSGCGSSFFDGVHNTLNPAQREPQPATVNALAQTDVNPSPVHTRGHAESREHSQDDWVANEQSEPLATRNPIGFTWGNEAANTPPVNCEREPASTPDREQADRQTREHQKSFADLADEIVNGTFFKTRGASQRAIKDFMGCRTNIAKAFRERLFAEGFIDAKGQVQL